MKANQAQSDRCTGGVQFKISNEAYIMVFVAFSAQREPDSKVNVAMYLVFTSTDNND